MFIIIRCKRCGRYSIRQVYSLDYVFKCFYCRKTQKIKLKRTFGLSRVVWKGYDWKEGKEVLKKLQEARRKTNEYKKI